jgi:hypothetical protein
MSCENLVCGACSGVVVEGRCTTCRATRAHVHESAGFPTSTVLWLALLVALLLVASLHLG